MPLQIADVGKEQRTFTWEYLGEEIPITYNLYIFTPEVEDEIEELVGDSEFQTRGLVQMVLHLVTDWEILDGEEKIPITREGLAKVPVRVLADLMSAIRDDAGGDEEEGKASGARSSRNREQRRHRGGTSSRQQGSFR